MTTSTKELSTPVPLHDFLFKYAGSVQAIYGGSIGVDRLFEAAQRLRELDKPDCVWTSTKVAEIDCFQPACTKSVMYFDLEKKQFCPNCGGAVKSGGTPNE